MKIDPRKLDAVVRPYELDLNCLIESHLKQSQPEFQADTWVDLLELPNPFSHDEALLLCQVSEDEWAAWIPEHGEVLLYTHQFRSKLDRN
jgi:hypothetical protein